MQLAARASCAVHPRLLPARPAACAARSRRQRGAPRVAAYPAESSPAATAAAAAADAVAELRQLVTRPRTNKQLVQKQLQVVEISLSALEKDAALVAKDVALVAAQKDAALAQKDAALAEKHAALVAAQKDFELVEKDLQELVRDYLDAKGMLHPRGLLEFAEERLLAPLSPTAKRDPKSKWQQLGRRHPELQECILKANSSWQPHLIPDIVEELHKRLSGQVHPGDLSRTGKVLLVEGPLTVEEIHLLECLARAVHCPYEVRYELDE